MFVLYFADTGYSDESMRFATKQEAGDFMAEHMGVYFSLRWED